MGRKPISNKTKKEIVELRRRGLSIREIADSILLFEGKASERFISKTSVHRVLSSLLGDTKE